MDSTSRRKVNPRVLVGKILFFNGVAFVGISLLLGAYTLIARGNSSSMVTGLLALIFAGVGLLEGLVGLLLWLLPGGESPTANVVNQYYKALQNQEYATALQYLELSIGTPWGQMITPGDYMNKAQDEFIKRAQEYDAEQGMITNYSLTGVQANPSKRVYTIRVIRQNGAAYTSKLHLMKQGNAWKIVGFDRF